jgi:hypothetical protein
VWVGNPRERAPVPHLLAPDSLVAQLQSRISTYSIARVGEPRKSAARMSVVDLNSFTIHRRSMMSFPFFCQGNSVIHLSTKVVCDKLRKPSAVCVCEVVGVCINTF